MQTEIIHVDSGGNGVSEALAQAEAVARYLDLPKKSTLHLRLLAEEMMSMASSMTGERELEFSIETSGRECRLKLVTETTLNAQLRSDLLSVSSSGQNAAAKGVLGKLRDIYERLVEPPDAGAPIYFNDMLAGGATGVNTWSLNQYRKSLGKNKDDEKNDELEKSILASIADEIEVGIRSDVVEMTIYKKFE